MGGGPSKIDYKERNFTKQPLDDQEIDILLQALPEENVIDSIDNDGREKILREMSGQKIFNIRGDNIFDYYFTNNRDELKSCMTSHINRDGTPCPDEKFNRMITRIPDLVQGPLGEKETEWDVERTGLESKYNTLDTAKTDLQGKYDTLEQKRQQNFETLALDRFLVNPEMYNKMLMEKMSQKALDIFTKDGDIDINVKEFVEHPSIKATLNYAYEKRQAMLLAFVEVFKKQASDLLNKFTKEVANQIKAQMPALVILFFIVQMKIAAQYSGVDKTKIVPNRTLYNYFSELFDELGIDQNNIDYTLKFITFNVFKKFMDYDSKNDVKGMDLYLQDFLKLIKQFGGDEYLNSLSDFDVNTDMTFDYVHANSGKPDLLVSENMCKLYMESKGYSFETVDYEGAPSGCLIYKDPNDKRGLFNRKFTEGLCSSESVDCVQKPPDVKNFLKTSIGNPDFSVSEFECKAYGESIGMWHSANNWSTYQTGCLSNADGKILYNRQSTAHNCEASKQCIQKKPKVDHFQKFSVGQPPSKYKEVTSGKPDRSVSQEECKAYMDSKGYGFTTEDNSGPNGCFVNFKNPDAQKGFYNTISREYDCQGADIPCIQKNPESVSKFECEQYANNTDGIEWGADTFTHDQRPKGCQIHPSNKVYFNDDNNNKNTSCSDAYKCILKPMKLTEHRKFKVVRDGSNDRTVSEQQCQAYANNLKKTMEQGNDTSGCYMAPKSNGIGIYYNKETGKGKCYMNGKTDFRMCIQQPLSKEDFSKVDSGKPLSKYKEVSSGKPDFSVSEENCKQFAEDNNLSWKGDTNNAAYPRGCVRLSGDRIFWVTNTGTSNCGDYSIDCIQKNNIYVSEQECKAYAKLRGKKGYGTTEWDSYPNGCFDNTTGGIYFNKGTADCATDRLCIEKALTKEDFKTVSSGNPSSKYKIVTSKKPDMSASKEECKEYSASEGGSFGIANEAGNPKGCFTQDGKSTYYNVNTDSTSDCGNSYGSDCVQKDPINVSEQQCKAYGISIGQWKNSGSWPSDPKGCTIFKDKEVYYNRSNTSVNCSNDYKCVQLK